MGDSIMTSFKLWRLRRRRKKGAKEYSKYIAEAKDAEDKEYRISEAMSARDEIRDEILHVRSLKLSDEAEELGIPVPSLSDKESWEDGMRPNYVRLTQKAQLELLRSIRAERREKWANLAFVLKEIVTPTIGVLGAIMGLISLIHVFRSK